MGKNVLQHLGKIDNLKCKNKTPAKIYLLSPVTNKSIAYIHFAENDDMITNDKFAKVRK